MKKIISTCFIFLSSGFISGIVFYYLIIIPLSGGGGVYVRVTGLKDRPYIVGEELMIEGIITNTQRNSSAFVISATLIPSEKKIETINSARESSANHLAFLHYNKINQLFLYFILTIIEGKRLSSNNLLSELNSVGLQTKNYFLSGGESRRFSFRIPTSNGIKEGKWFLNFLVFQPSYSGLKLFGKDEVVFSKMYNIYFTRSLAELNNIAVSSESIAVTGPLSKRGVTETEFSRKIKTRITPKIVEEEIVSAEFKVIFPEDKTLHYNRTLIIPVYIKNKSSGQEQFEVFLKILSPDGRERIVSKPISLSSSEEKRLDFIYYINNGYSEGEYNFAVWYKTKQAISEEVFEAKFTLLDEEPQIKVKRMLINPLERHPTEVIVEVIDDVGVREVFLVATPIKTTGERGESKNIPMKLVEGDDKKGLWMCEYIPQRSDVYGFSFVAIDTKRQRRKTGEFPIKVRK